MILGMAKKKLVMLTICYSVDLKSQNLLDVTALNNSSEHVIQFQHDHLSLINYDRSKELVVTYLRHIDPTRARDISITNGIL
jgi:hypothetical protein